MAIVFSWEGFEMRGSRGFYIRALIVTIIAIACSSVWDASTVSLGIFIYFVIQEIVFFIIERKREKQSQSKI